MPSTRRRSILVAPLVVLAMVATGMQMPLAGAAQTFTVTTDNDAGAGSLRQAILDANNAAGDDTIEFDFTDSAPYVISLGSALDPITEPVVIDGTSQAGYPGAGGPPVVQVDGTLILPGPAAHGFDVNAPDVTITGLSITGFSGSGIRAGDGAAADGAALTDNYIGVDPDGVTDSGNGDDGITISNAAGAEVGGNVIAGNGGSGVELVGTTDGVTISNNSVHDNDALGIDLGGDGVTANDGADDLDAGPNGLQNFPELSSASATSVDFSLASAAATDYEIEVFANTECDASTNGEGQTFLGSATAPSDIDGLLEGTISFTAQPLGTELTATATDMSTGDTSEFSGCATVDPSADLGVAIDPTSPVVAGQPGGVMVHYSNASGSDPAANVDLTISLPGTFDQIVTGPSDTNMTCGPASAGVVHCTLDPLASDSSGSVEVSFRTPTAPGSPEVTASISSDTQDPNGSNDDATAPQLLTDATPGFAPATSYDLAAGAGAHSVITGLFDGDAHRDVVVTNPAAGTASILLGSASGALGNAAPVTLAGAPRWIAAGSMDGGTTLDLLANTETCTGSDDTCGTLTFAAGDGNGGFGSPAAVDVANAPQGIALHDLDDDGELDLLAADRVGADLSVSLGNGDGTFDAPNTYGTTGDQYGIEVDDLNGDGELDAVTTSASAATVFLGNGDGTFEDGVDYAVSSGSSTPWPQIADLNDDTVPDIAVSGNAKVLLNAGDGTFEDSSEQLSTSAFFIAKGDFNADGQADLEAAATGTTPPTPDLLQLRGTGEGTFADGPTGLLQYRVTSSIGAGDLNGDGTRDLILPNGGADKVTVLLTTPNPGVSSPAISHSPEPQETGFSSIETASLDFSGVALTEGTLETSAGPLAAPIPSKPIPSKPMPSKPMPSKPMPSKPMPSKGVGAAAPLSAMPLSALIAHDIPNPPKLTQVGLDLPGGWTQVLTDAGSPLAVEPLQNIDFNQVSRIPEVAEITLDHFDFSQTALGSLPAAAFLYGETPLSDIGLPAGYTWDGPGGLVQQMIDEPCTDPSDLVDPDDLSQTLVDLSLLRCPIALAPWSTMLLRHVGLTEANAPLHSLLFTGIDVTKVEYVLGGDTVTLADLTLDRVPAGIVDCTSLDCTAGTGDTLADAQTQDVFEPFSTFGMLFEGGASVIGDMTLGNLLLGVVQQDGFPYENVSLENLLAAATPGSAGSVAYTVSFDVTCPVPSDTQVRVRLPNGQFGFVAGSADFTFDGGSPVDAGHPATGANGRLTWDLPNSATVCGGGSAPVHVVLTFDAQPAPSAGTFISSVAIVNDDGDTARAKDVPLTLTPADEPNDTPAGAIELSPDTLYTGGFTSPTDVDFYEVPAGPGDLGSLVTVYLSHMSSDDDLVIYGSAADSLAAAPIPSKPIPSKSVGDQEGCLPTGYVLQPQTLDDVPQLSSPGSAVRGFSTNRSTQEEVVCTTVQVGDLNDVLLIQVTHNSGPIDGDTYVLRANVQAPPDPGTCPVRTFDHAGDGSTLSTTHTVLANQVVPAGTRTLILMNETRFGDTYGAADEQATVDELELLAAQTDGAIVPLESSTGPGSAPAAYTALDAAPCSPEAANAVVRSINEVVADVTTGRPTPEYIVLVGDDDQIPFARLQDLTTLGNQVAYAANLQFDGQSNPESAAFARGMFLSDDPYSSLSPAPWIGNLVYLPDIALGRLVESPQEIQGQIQQFLTYPSGLDPKTALVTGTDFSKDVANQILGDLSTRAADLNTDTGTTDYSTRSLIDDSWTRQKAVCRLHGSDVSGDPIPCTNATPQDFTPPGLISVNGHFDHYRALPGDRGAAGLLSSQDFVDSEAAAGSLLFTIGCNSGVSVPDAYLSSPGAPQALDWAQALARKQGSLVANNGFGYGDTTRIAYSERLMKLFASRLDGSFSVGQALRDAKRAYWLELATYSPYDIKSLEQSTFYGLPMYSISGTGEPGGTTPPSIELDPATGLNATDVSLPAGSDPFFVDPVNDLRTGAGGTGQFFVGPRTQVITGYPIEPISNPIDMTASVGQDLRLHGAIVTSLQKQDFTNFDPVVGSTQLNGAAAGVEPTIAVGISPTDYLTTSFAGGKDSLVLYGGRFTANLATPGLGTQRIYREVSARGFYAPQSSTDFTPPDIFNNSGELLPGGFASFRVSTSASDVRAAYVMYLPTSATQFKLTQLSGIGGGTYQGTVSAPTGVSEFFTQIVDNSGNVAIDTFKGSTLALLLPPSPPPGISATILPAPGTTVHNGWYSGPVTVRIQSSFYQAITTRLDGVSSGSGLFTVNVAVPGTDGLRRVDYTVGSFSSAVVVPIDKAEPVISHIIGQIKYEPGEDEPPFVATGATITVNVADPSGIETCSINVRWPDGTDHSAACGEGDNPVTLAGGDGRYTVTTTATDNAGNTVVDPHTFDTRRDSTPPTITPGVSGVQFPTYNGSNDPVYVTSLTDLTIEVRDPDSVTGPGSGVKDCTTTLTSSSGLTCFEGDNTYHAQGADGQKILATSARDNVLNQSSRSLDVTLDNTEPTVTGAVTGSPTYVPPSGPSAGRTFVTSATQVRMTVNDPAAGSRPGSGVKDCTTSLTANGPVGTGGTTTLSPTGCAAGTNDYTLAGSTPDGRYHVQTSARDNVLNENAGGGGGSPVDVSLDNNAPIFASCPTVNPGVSARLATAITSLSQTSFKANELASPPHTRFVVTIDAGTPKAEVMLVTKRARVSGSTSQFTYTVTRGFDGGTRFTHVVNAPVQWTLIARQDLLGKPSVTLTDSAAATTLELTGERFGLPAAPFLIVVDQEQMLVKSATTTGVGTYDLTVVRGYNGTQLGTHTTSARAVWSGQVYGTVTTAFSATAAAFSVTEGRFGAPSVPFEITVGTERMTVVKQTSSGGGSYTYDVARGVDGTKALAHAAADAVWTTPTTAVYLHSPQQVLSVPVTDDVVSGVDGSGVSSAGFSLTAGSPAVTAGTFAGGMFSFTLDPNGSAGVATFPVSIDATDNLGNASTPLGNVTAATSNPPQLRCWYEIIYALRGFSSPIENDALNKVNSGSSTPTKWRITDYDGVPVNDSATFVSVTASGSKTCDTAPEYTVLDQQIKGGTSFKNFGNGDYQFNWLAPSSFKNTCRTVVLRLASSGLNDPLPIPGTSTVPSSSRRYGYTNFTIK